jgi:hypothetical protein
MLEPENMEHAYGLDTLLPHLGSVQASLVLTYELHDLLGHLLQINFGEISESDDCQFFFEYRVRIASKP